jgi:hypothetical protein
MLCAGHRLRTQISALCLLRTSRFGGCLLGSERPAMTIAALDGSRSLAAVNNGDSADNPAELPVRRLPSRYIQVISSPDEPATTNRETKDDEARAGSGQPGAQTTVAGRHSGVERALLDAVANATVDRCCHEGRTRVLRWCATCNPQGMRRRGRERAFPSQERTAATVSVKADDWLIALGHHGHPEGLELNRKRWEQSQRFSAFVTSLSSASIIPAVRSLASKP